MLACFYILQLLIQQAFRLLSFNLKHSRDVSLYYGSVVPAAAPRSSFFLNYGRIIDIQCLLVSGVQQSNETIQYITQCSSQ